MLSTNVSTMKMTSWPNQHITTCLIWYERPQVLCEIQIQIQNKFIFEYQKNLNSNMVKLKFERSFYSNFKVCRILIWYHSTTWISEDFQRYTLQSVTRCRTAGHIQGQKACLLLPISSRWNRIYKTKPFIYVGY